MYENLHVLFKQFLGFFLFDFKLFPWMSDPLSLSKCMISLLFISVCFINLQAIYEYSGYYGIKINFSIVFSKKWQLDHIVLNKINLLLIKISFVFFMI